MIKNLQAFFIIALASLTMIFISSCNQKPAETKVGQSINKQYPHPLNPLDTVEINSVKEILLAEGKIDTTWRFYFVSLQEPPKSEMLSYQAGQEFTREAFASVYDRATNKTFEATIDLKAGKVLKFENIPGVTPGMFLQDSIAVELVKNNKEWQEGLAKRDIHPDSVTTFPYIFAGELGIAPADHREVICAPYYKNKKFGSIPVDGLVAYVDITAGKVLKVLDDGGKGYYKPFDVEYFNADSGKVYLPKTKPLKISQPEGTTFAVEGYNIKSPLWSMRVGLHSREGLILYDVKYNDHGNMRSIIYRASLAEMYVPYGSTDLYLSSWNYFDGGAYRMGQSLGTKRWGNKMKVGADVPEHAAFIPAYFHDEKGRPKKLDSLIAVYEEFPGPATRHGSFSKDARHIVVKYFTKIGNYDYGFKWIFRDDGTIDMKVELTGIVGIKAVNRTTDLPGGPDPTSNGAYYGTLVAPHIEAVNHQHFFSFRLDLDVDGPDNLVEEMNTVAVGRGKDNPWNNAFVTQMSLIKNEAEGMRNLNVGSNRHWMFANAKAMNSLGQPKSYIIMPGQNSKPYAAPGSPARKMADFLESQVWVTAHHDQESFPAGTYPNSRGIKDGLPTWTNQEDLQGKDAVMWYNMGITHIVRPEDWPIMNVHQVGFTLAPFGFFDQNPVAGMRAPENTKIAGAALPPDMSMCVPLPKQ